MVRIHNSHFWSDHIRRPMLAIQVWMAAVRSVLIGRNGFRHLMVKGPMICLSWQYQADVGGQPAKSGSLLQVEPERHMQSVLSLPFLKLVMRAIRAHETHA